MKKIELEYTIEIDKVLIYWQNKLEKLWSKKQRMDNEIEMIDNTISYLRALKQIMDDKIEVIIQDESNTN